MADAAASRCAGLELFQVSQRRRPTSVRIKSQLTRLEVAPVLPSLPAPPPCPPHSSDVVSLSPESTLCLDRQRLHR